MNSALSFQPASLYAGLLASRCYHGARDIPVSRVVSHWAKIVYSFNIAKMSDTILVFMKTQQVIVPNPPHTCYEVTYML